MANVVTPKLSNVGGAIQVKTYSYGGSTRKMGDTPDYSDYEDIDYSANTETKEAKGMTAEKLLKAAGDAYLTYAGSLCISAVGGIVETLGDGILMAGGFLSSKGYKALGWLMDKMGKTDKAKEYRKMSQDIESTFQEVIEYNWSGALYDKYVEAVGIDESIAYGPIHTVTTTVGTMAAYTAATIATGGAAASLMVGVGAVSAAGASAQKAFQNGATFNEAALNAGVSAAMGAASGATMGALGGAARGATSGLQVAGLTAAGAAAGAATPAVTSAVEYNTYGKDQYSSYNAYAKDTGAYTSMATGAAIGGASIGIQAAKAYSEVRPWSKQKGIDKELVKTAEKNYQEHSKDFTSRKDYYRDLADTESKTAYESWEQDPATGKWKQTQVAKRISESDEGITRSVTPERKLEWQKEVDTYTTGDKTKVHVGNTSTQSFEKFVLGDADDYGTLGFSHSTYESGGTMLTDADGYQFVSMGDGDASGMINRAGGSNVVRQFETDLGLPQGESDRMIMTTYDVDRSSVQMPTGKELGSNNQRIPGGRTPNGNLEAVHQTIHLDSSQAESVKVDIIANNGSKPVWSGSLAELKEIQMNDPVRYNQIMGKAV